MACACPTTAATPVLSPQSSLPLRGGGPVFGDLLRRLRPSWAPPSRAGGHSPLPLLVEVGVEGRGLPVALASSVYPLGWLLMPVMKGTQDPVDQAAPCTPEAERVAEGSDCPRAGPPPRGWGKVVVAPCRGLGGQDTGWFPTSWAQARAPGASGEAWVRQATPAVTVGLPRWAGGLASGPLHRPCPFQGAGGSHRGHSLCGCRDGGPGAVLSLRQPLPESPLSHEQRSPRQQHPFMTSRPPRAWSPGEAHQGPCSGCRGVWQPRSQLFTSGARAGEASPLRPFTVVAEFAPVASGPKPRVLEGCQAGPEAPPSGQNPSSKPAMRKGCCQRGPGPARRAFRGSPGPSGLTGSSNAVTRGLRTPERRPHLTSPAGQGQASGLQGRVPGSRPEAGAVEGSLICVLPPRWEVAGWSCPQERFVQDLGAAVRLGPLSPAGRCGARAARPAGSGSPAPGVGGERLFLRQPPCARLARVSCSLASRARGGSGSGGIMVVPRSAHMPGSRGRARRMSSSGHGAVDSPSQELVLVSRVQ